jgi:aminopeptidase N
MLLRLLICALFLSVMNVFSQTPPLETGVSQTLAKWRAANYSDVRYKLNLTLEKMSPLMKGDIEIRVILTDEGARNDLILDWRQLSFANTEGKPFAYAYEVNNADESKVSTRFEKEHLIIAGQLLIKGENVIKIRFASPIKTSGGAITRYVDKEDGAEYVYSLFVPSDASTAFPVFDQPDLKARFSLIIDAPKNWKVISNTGDVTAEGNDISAWGLTFKNVGHLFAETKPISTYVFDDEFNVIFRRKFYFAHRVPQTSPHHRAEKIVFFVLDIFLHVIAAFLVKQKDAVAVILVVWKEIGKLFFFVWIIKIKFKFTCF